MLDVFVSRVFRLLQPAVDGSRGKVAAGTLGRHFSSHRGTSSKTLKMKYGIIRPLITASASGRIQRLIVLFGSWLGVKPGPCFWRSLMGDG